MLGPDTLKHIIYPLLVIIFISVITYMFVYNAKSKKRQEQLVGKNPASKEAGILSAEESMKGRNQP